MNPKRLVAVAVTLVALGLPLLGQAQSLFSEDFTGTTTNNNWFFFNGACLTAGTNTSLTSPGPVPGCATVFGSYYGVANASTGKSADADMTGGYAGYLGSSTKPTAGSPVSATTITPDPVTTVGSVTTGYGALRFTNGYPYGYHENGAIVSAFTVSSGQGLEITFKTTTYLGDSGGGGHDGADGISFYLLDGCMPITGGLASGQAGAVPPSGCASNPIYEPAGTTYPASSLLTFPAIGAWGGSLAYTCSNANPPFHGLTGAYLGLGIDEYGNFLNGTTNTLGETGTSATGDNTASGGGYQPGRIGLRGAGSVSWQGLTTAYGTATSSGPYYPASLATTCSNGGAYSSSTGTCGPVCSNGGVYNASTNTCGDTCNSGYTFNSTTNLCQSCNAGATYSNTGSGSCAPTTYCPNGGTWNSSNNTCSNECTTGSYNSGTNKCDVCPTGPPVTTFDVANTANGATNAKPCAKCSNGGSYTVGGTCSNGATHLSWVAQSSATTPPNQPTAALTTQAPITGSPVTGAPIYTSAVQKTCSTGHLWNYTNPVAPTDAGTATLSNTANTAGILDYAAIPGAYSVLSSSSVKIANEGATTRAGANPIFYDVKITQDGLLSFSYSTNGLSYTSVINKQPITASNGPLPGALRFGFAGSTGGSTNIHEIECFKAAAASQSASSTTANQRQSAKIIQNTTQAYFAYYDPSDNSGRLTANFLGTDSNGNVIVNSTANWDASCVLTGVPSGQTCLTTGAGPSSAQTPASRVMLTWNSQATPAQGIPFEWGNLSTQQQSAIDNLDSSQNGNRVNYLRGDRTNEVDPYGVGLFRRRDYVLGDIIDSSPSWVGPPQSPYTVTWQDALNPGVAAPENQQPYSGFVTSYQQRQNVVYSGANDGFLHGFRTGTFDASGNFSGATNDGQEVLAYMPNAVLQTIHTVVQTAPGVIDGTLDFSNTQYIHNFYVDAPPGSGDLFYANTACPGGCWHTWLVGGLGAGGAAIYALDVTDPTQFSEGNAAKLVIGEWTPSTIPGGCANSATCGNSLGQTYGTPQIRRLHDGKWGIIFGNGLNSSSGDAGIFVLTVSPTNGSTSLYYLSTGTSGTSNGIAYVTPADLDGDHITDYVYAGDLNGNVWRFDLTSSSEANWAVSTLAGASGPTPLFTTPAGEPITTKVTVASGTSGAGLPRIMLGFGTGQKFPYTISGPTTYSTAQQALYGVWDWNVTTNNGTTGQTAWNNQSNVKYAGLAPSATGLPTNQNNVIERGNLVQQVISVDATNGDRDITTNATVCWTGTTACTSGNNQFGWYLLLPGTNEQIIYNPEIVGPAFTVNSIVPANNVPTSCTLNTDTGYTYAISIMSGGAFTNTFGQTPNTSGLPQYHDTNAAGIQTNATGTSFVVLDSSGKTWFVFQTVNNTPVPIPVNLPKNTTANRLTWEQLR